MDFEKFPDYQGHNIGFWHGLFLTTATVWMVMGTVFYLKKEIIDISFSSSPKVLGTSIQFNPSPDRVRLNWNTFLNAKKGYSFRYPPEWGIEEKDGFINSTHIYPPGREFEIIYSAGEIPNMVGRISPTQDSIIMNIQNKEYKIQEHTINNTQKFFHLVLEHPSQPLNITTRTLTSDFFTYAKEHQTILDIIATTSYIPIQSATTEAGFSVLSDSGLQIYYPSGLQITSRTDSEVVWGDQLLILHNQLQNQEEPKTQNQITIQNPNTVITIQRIKSEDITIADLVTTKKYYISCGKDCAYQLIRFRWNNQQYELIFKGASKREKYIFDKIIDAIRFE